MHSFRLVETPCYTAEKNTIDMVPASDAMDILHGGGIDRLCIAASDGDYTMLAQRIREAGLTVLGYGEGKTPERSEERRVGKECRSRWSPYH